MNVATMTPPKTYTVLLLDPDSSVGASVESYWQHYYQGELSIQGKAVASIEEAQAFLKQQPVDLLLFDLNPVQDETEAWMVWLKKELPDVKRVFWTTQSTEQVIRFLKQQHILTVLTKEVPFDFTHFSKALEAILKPSLAYGLDTYLKANATINSFTLTSSDHIQTTFHTLQRFLDEQECVLQNEMLTALVEAVTNAVYHAPKDASGKDKYAKGMVIEQLEPLEEVTVTYGFDDEKLGISVRDQGGSLNPEQVLFWLERNMSGSNLLDVSGRGLFLMHTLADHFVLNVEQGKQTEIIMLQYKAPQNRVAKPLYLLFS